MQCGARRPLNCRLLVAGALAWPVSARGQVPTTSTVQTACLSSVVQRDILPLRSNNLFSGQIMPVLQQKMPIFPVGSSLAARQPSCNWDPALPARLSHGHDSFRQFEQESQGFC